jgi:hypothetical protein
VGGDSQNVGPDLASYAHYYFGSAAPHHWTFMQPMRHISRRYKHYFRNMPKDAKCSVDKRGWDIVGGPAWVL